MKTRRRKINLRCHLCGKYKGRARTSICLMCEGKIEKQERRREQLIESIVVRTLERV
jgi:hypothetical protein